MITRDTLRKIEKGDPGVNFRNVAQVLRALGVLEATVDAVGEDSTLGRITRLVENAQSGKAPVQRLVDRISAVFVPTVVGVAVLVLGLWLASGASLETALAPAIAVLVTGVLRVVLGDKGVPTYMGNWLLHLKFTGFIVIALLSIGPTLAYRRWLKALNADGSLPSAAEVGKTRKLVMIEAHLGALLPLAATFMARGWGS